MSKPEYPRFTFSDEDLQHDDLREVKETQRNNRSLRLEERINREKKVYQTSLNKLLEQKINKIALKNLLPPEAQTAINDIEYYEIAGLIDLKDKINHELIKSIPIANNEPDSYS